MKSTTRPNLRPITVILATWLIVSVGAQSGDGQQLIASSSSNHLRTHPQSSHPYNNQQLTSTAGLFKDLSGPISGKIQTLDVICGKNFMTVRAEFSAPFYGIIFSKGTYGHENCIYVKPNSGLTSTAFNVYYDQCGTKPDLQGKFYENTIVIQYGSDIIEAYDEAKRLRCEWFEAYEKPATFKPAIPVADLEVVEMNFQGDDIDCWMEIQEGVGGNSREVSKLVSVGQPMTIVVAINDYSGIFDMRVKSCVAHDGVNQPIALTDEYGCVLRPKMLTAFTKVRNPSSDKKATILSYSRFLAFKFPDSLTVQIQCTVEVCRHGCADACQRIPSTAATTLQPEISIGPKWPSAANQAAIESVVQAQRVQAPKRHDEDYKPIQATRASSRPSGFSNEPSPVVSDDMSGSDSNQQAKYVPVGAQEPPASTQRRSQQGPGSHLSQAAADFIFEGKLPQYMMPIDQQHGRRLSAGSSANRQAQQQSSSTQQAPTTTTTLAPTTMVQTQQPTTTLWPTAGADNRQQPGEEPTEQPSVGDPESSGPSRLNSAGDQSAGAKPVELQGEQAAEAQPSVQADPMDNKAEASNVKLSVVPSITGAQGVEEAAREDDKLQGAEQTASGEAGSKAPEEPAGSQQPADKSSNADSSLKTVEVEIPANEEMSAPFMAGQQAGNPFNSARISNLDANQPTGSNQESKLPAKALEDQYDSAGYKQQEQIIHPRESQLMAKREKADADASSNIELAMMGTGKARFGTRQSAGAAVVTSSNHQEAPAAAAEGSSLEADLRELPGASISSADVGSNSEKIDRSDEASELTFASPIIENLNKGGARADEGSPTYGNSESSGLPEDSLGKIKPVVGTEELASGPLEMEHRFGAPAPQETTIEEALKKLQQQIQPAGLETQKSQMKPGEAPQSSAVQPSQADKSSGADERADPSINFQDGKHQSAPKSGIQQREQQFPNVVGQAKVLPDPSTSSNMRNSLMAQASNETPSGGVLPAVQLQQQQQGNPIANIVQQQQQQKPLAQITNVPLPVAFNPNLQQLQQMALFRQQQQQQQQQQQMVSKPVPQSTPKPSVRSRLNLLSPHAALHAVASRFLPKSSTAAPSTGNPASLPLAQQLPHLLSNMKLLPELQKSQVQAAHVGQQNSFLAKQQAYFPNRLSTSNPQQPLPVAPAQPASSSGLFSRFTKQQPQQQQLVRSRRSAIMPSGKQQGTGEVGITKTFMVVTNMDLAFAANMTSPNELPEVLEGRRLVDESEGEVIYGVCMPIVSLTFVLTCVFWLIVFIISFCIYTLIKSKKLLTRTSSKEEFIK